MAESSAPIPTISGDSIKVIAETVGIANLKGEVAEALAADVEYRLRDLVQEALKFMKHGRRETLSTDDVNFALRLRNAEPLYGFASGEAPRFCRATGASDVYYLDDPEVNLADLVAKPLPKVPLEPSFCTHWLAVHGAQPAVPQNPSEDEVAAARAQARKRRRDEEAPAPAAAAGDVEVVPLARHALTKEQQDWLDKVTAAVRATRDHGPLDTPPAGVSQVLASALRSVAQDGGTHPLSPYLVKFICDEVNSNLRCLPMLSGLMRLLQAMLASLSVDLEPSLHQLMPAVLTCVVGKRLCSSPLEDHWRLRHQAAWLATQLLDRYKDKYPDLLPRVTQTLLEALRDRRKPLSTHYGAIVGLQLLGPLVVHCLLLPACPAYLAQLDEPLGLATAPPATAACAAAAAAAAAAGSAANGAAANGGGGLSAKARKAAATEASLRKTDALRVRGALLHVCGVYFFRHGHLFSASAAPTPPADADADADMSAAPALLTSQPPPPHEPTAGGGKAPPAQQQQQQQQQRSIGSKRDAPEAEGSEATQPAGSVTHLAVAELLPRIAVQYEQLSAQFGPSLTPYMRPVYSQSGGRDLLSCLV